MTIDEAEKFQNYPVYDLSEEQATIYQLISDGWAYPLKAFMNELQTQEVLTNRSLVHELGREPMSMPLTLEVTGLERARLMEANMPIALKCSKYS